MGEDAKITETRREGQYRNGNQEERDDELDDFKIIKASLVVLEQRRQASKPGVHFQNALLVCS